MKHYILLSLLLVLSASLWGQTYRGAACFSVTELMEENDSLHIGMRIHIRSHSVESARGMRMAPALSAGDSTLWLPDIFIMGGNKTKVYRRWLSLRDKNKNYGDPHMLISVREDTDTTLYYAMHLPYRLWMDSARMTVSEELAGYNNKRSLIRLELPGQVELEPRHPYQVQPQVSLLIPEREVKTRKRQGKAFLDFQVGRSVIIPSFRRNPEELAKIDEAVQDIKNNQDVQITGLYIEGYASPEGKYETNERLSRERATALKEYIRGKFGFGETLFKVSWTPEDWDGLVAAVQAGNMDYKDKVLETIASTDILDGRERKLMGIASGIPYRKMLKEIFPELRRVEYQIDYTVKDYTLEESKVLAAQKPEQLSQRELYMLAESYGSDSPEYKNILLETIPRYYPGDATANNNAAAVMILQGEPNTAARLLDKAGDSPEAINNRGVIYLLAGELDKAEELFLKARERGVVQAAHNLMEAQTKQEDNKKMERYNRK